MIPRCLFYATILHTLLDALSSAVVGQALDASDRSRFFQLVRGKGGNILQRIPSQDIVSSGSDTDNFSSSVLLKLRGHGEGEKSESKFDVLLRGHRGSSSSKSGKGSDSKSKSSKREKSKGKGKRKQRSSEKKGMASSRRPMGKRKQNKNQRQAPSNQPVQSPSRSPVRLLVSAGPSSSPSTEALRDGTQSPTFESVDILAPTVDPNAVLPTLVPLPNVDTPAPTAVTSNSGPTLTPDLGTPAPTAVTSISGPTLMPLVQTSPQPTSTDQASPRPTIDSTVISNSTASPSTFTNSTRTLAPTIASVLRVGVPRFFISAVSSGATTSPTPNEYELILNATEEYFNQVLVTEYGNNDDIDFLFLDLELNNTRFELGVPEARYNRYMDFAATAAFTESSTPPTAQNMFDILRRSVNVTYITDILRDASGTPFAGSTEVFFASAVGTI